MEGAAEGEVGGMSQGKTLTIRTSPHLASGASVDTIMFHVVLALLPVTAFAVYSFGLGALAVIVTAVTSCVLCEHLLCRRQAIRRAWATGRPPSPACCTG